MMMMKLAFNCLISKGNHFLLEFCLIIVSSTADTAMETSGLWGGCGQL